MIGVEDRQLLTQPRLVFTECVDSTPNRRDMLTAVQVQPLYERRIDLPTSLGQDRLDGLCGTEYDAVFHPHDAPAPIRFDHLSIEQVRLGHPTRLGLEAFGLSALGLNPLPVVSPRAR